MAEVFELKIISPDAMFFEGEADFLEFTSVEGGMGVYKNHIPLTTILEPCVMNIHNGTEVKKAAILGGFLEILQDKITVLAEDAQWPDEIKETCGRTSQSQRTEHGRKKSTGRSEKSDCENQCNEIK